MTTEMPRDGQPIATVRHALIRRIISEHEIHSQSELVAHLEKEGYRSTQATISRDLAMLGAHKVHSADGHAVYALPAEGPGGGLVHGQSTEDLRERLAQISRTLVVSARCAGNLLVLHSPVGAANYLGSAIDQLHIGDILGSIAGDDTLLIILDTPESAERLERALTPGRATV